MLELLVVIAIIAILAALLIPSLRRGKQKAQGIVCLGQLKQLQYGWVMYANDHPASYHNGAGGLTFADGHAEYHKWIEPTTTPVLQPGQRLESGSKPTSPGDRDMSWLVTRTTSATK